MHPVALTLVVCLGAGVVVAQNPEQVHISLTGRPDYMAVDWVQTGANGSAMRWSADPNFSTFNTVAPSVETLLHTYNSKYTWFCFAAEMGPLVPTTTYYYQLTNTKLNNWTSSFSFKMRGERPPVAMILADFGLTNDQALSGIIEDAAAGAFDLVIQGAF